MLKFATLILAAALLSQCSKEGEEKNYDVRLSVKSPLIHFTPSPIGGFTIDSNWFLLNFSIQNNSELFVRVEEVLFTYSDNGQETIANLTGLALLDKVDAAGNTYRYENYCTYAPRGTAILFGGCRNTAKPVGCSDSSSKVCEQTDTSTFAPPYVPISLYVQGLPNLQGEDRTHIYPIKMELLGVFQDADGVETDRFTKRIYFVTR